jgi:hypothetical protein
MLDVHNSILSNRDETETVSRFGERFRGGISLIIDGPAAGATPIHRI